MFAALLFSFAILSLSSLPAQSDGSGMTGFLPGSLRVPPDSLAGASAADSTSAGGAAPAASEPAGPDIRAVRSGGVARFLSRRPLARLVGSGGFGDRASLARGALPATMTAVLLEGGPLDAPLSGGLALHAARAVADGVLLVPAGPDLSLLPIFTASRVDGPLDVLADGRGLDGSAVVVWPGRSPGPTPWARLSMGRGDLDWSATGAEFGRTYAEGRFGVSCSFERREAAAPQPAGADTIQQGGLRSTFDLRDGWHAEVAARRFTLDRSVVEGSSPMDEERVESGVRLAIGNAGSRFEVFHATGWIRSGRRSLPRSAESADDGLSAVVGIGRAPIDTVRIRVERVSADGSLLAGEEAAVRISGMASGRLSLAAGSLRFSAGGDRLGASAFPVAAVELAGPWQDGIWRASAEVGGRHPTAVERLAAPLDLAGDVAAPLSLRGNQELGPESAITLRAGCAWPGVLSGVGAAGEFSRILGPIALRPVGGSVVRPVNADDESAGAATVWAAAGDSLEAGARTSVNLFWMEEGGALIAPSPAPRASFSADAWWTSRFFEGGFLEVRWELSLSHEVGLARGLWEGHVDDSVTRVDACAGASAGPVRVFLEVRDLLDSAGSRVPGRPSDGRLIAAGFSTSLWN